MDSGQESLEAEDSVRAQLTVRELSAFESLQPELFSGIVAVIVSIFFRVLRFFNGETGVLEMLSGGILGLAGVSLSPWPWHLALAAELTLSAIVGCLFGSICSRVVGLDLRGSLVITLFGFIILQLALGNFEFVV
jgi:hypothetical protein